MLRILKQSLQISQVVYLQHLNHWAHSRPYQVNVPHEGTDYHAAILTLAHYASVIDCPPTVKEQC